MSISFFTFLMAFLWSSIFIVAAAILQRRKPTIIYMYLFPLLLISILSIARLFISVELPFTKVLPSTIILPKAIAFLEIPIFAMGDFTVYIKTILLFVWIVGISVFLAEMFISYNRFQKYMLHEKESEDNRIHTLMDEIIANSKLSTKVKVIQTTYVDTPILIGFFKPIIYLPDIPFTDTELKYVLMHEWAHYKHKDLWIKLLFNAFCSVYWWNPLIYLLKRDANHLLELKSDLHLTKQLSQESRTQYLETLLKVAKGMTGKNRTQNFSSFSVNFVSCDNGWKIKQRFQLINRYKPMNILQKSSNLCICILMLLTFAASFLFVVQSCTPAPPGSFTINEDSACLKDNQDGSYSFFSDGLYIGEIYDITVEPFSSFPVR